MVLCTDTCTLSNNIMDYYVVSQGKTTIPGVDDGEEFQMTDVRKCISVQNKTITVLDVSSMDVHYAK